ncbi:MAG TPA: CsiV family protein, partial [Steroidobacteraceae bacterium]|nr:CsiV family protein [Steroidobacteraceae bacterium]
IGIGANVAQAQDQADPERLYDVELVVFRNLNATAFGTPELAADPEVETPGTSEVDPVPATGVVEMPGEPEPLPEEVTLLPAEGRTLNAIEAALKRSADYRPIAHLAWSQPGRSRGSAPRIPLNGQLEGTGLTGEARLGVGRFLHLDLELSYLTDEGQMRTITQSRRMRSGERHYFDDPAFGVIAVVTRRDEAR